MQPRLPAPVTTLWSGRVSSIGRETEARLWLRPGTQWSDQRALYRHARAAGVRRLYSTTEDLLRWTQGLFGESPTKFFLKIVVAQVEFGKDARGTVTHLVLHQGSVEVKARRKK